MNEQSLQIIEQPEVRRYADVAPVISIQEAIERHQQLAKYVGSVMVEGHDFGTIPGTDKPSLKKPGAEKLTTFFGLTKRLFIVEKVEDWTGEQHGGEPFFYYLYRCALYRGDQLIAEADGSCNSRETKYRWREMQRQCPTCGAYAIIKGKEEFGGGWLCFQRKGGCNAKFDIDDPAITLQQTGRVPNPEIADQVNTIQKMAAKRALIAVTLLAVNASEFFTQDVEDLTHEQPQSPPPKPTGSDNAARTTEATPAANSTPKSQPAPPPAQQQARTMPSHPLARDLQELATPKQVTLIRATCRDLNLDAEAELQKLIKLDAKVEELSRKAASIFIDHLKQLEASPERPPGRRSGAEEVSQQASPASPPPVPLTLVEPPQPTAEDADPFADLDPTPAPTTALDRNATIAEIKNTVLTLKFATTLHAWQEFERGLCGRLITELTDGELIRTRDAIRKAAVNTELLGWHAEKWVGEHLQKVYLMGLIVMHAEVDGFEKTKAIVGNPANYRSPERIDLTAKNLLSWVRPEALQQEAA
ncbi:MAG: hypothetical protein U0Y68_04045 [Blastocatellia bacterium]